MTNTPAPGQESASASVDPAEDVAIEVRKLVKSYGRVPALAGIDLRVGTGEIVALLGPNGAGKTTTVEILEGFRSRDHGDVSVLGCDPETERDELKRRIGFVLQSTGVEPYLTVRETVAMYGELYPHHRPADEVLELVGLAAKRGARVNQLSGGQQRRLDMAVALVGDPELLFLDEPTTGFDPSARREAWDVVKDLASLGKTVVLTTHFMDEAQYLADRVVVIAKGQIVAEGPPSTLGFRDQAKAQVRYRLPVGLAPPPALTAPPNPDGFVELALDDPTKSLYELLGWALEHGVELEGLEVKRPSLEDVYLALTDGAAATSSAAMARHGGVSR